ncbi:MAG TPA: chromate efflux transporter [Dehalococcoidia bacterium]|nr:chromate efflux transporter [Dehalococcoidia bacterium]
MACDVSSRSTVGEVALLFLKLGVVGFGGPAAHIAMMRDEVVRRRGWLTDGEFLDLLGATNLIPGPNSTEMAIHLGLRRAGVPGLLAGGLGFILPAFAIVSALAWAYVEYGSRPQADWLLYGVKPVVIVIVVQALVGLARTALRRAETALLAAGGLGLYLAGANEIAVLFAGGAVLVALRLGQRLAAPSGPFGSWWPAAAGATALASQAGMTPFSYSTLFLTFLKIGSVLYGSGYVLLAFLRADLVERLGWLTERQLLDAVAVGQVTPGPVFTTATFIGYVLGGWWGTVVATVGIFLPSFVFVAASHPLIPRLRSSALASAFLDGVNAVAVALMAGVTFQLGSDALVDPLTVAIAAGAAAAATLWRPNSAWLVVAGGAAGFLARGVF